MEKLDDLQPTSHPLKWRYLVDTVERSGLEDPDIWIEDVRDYGPCIGVEAERVMDDTDCIQASFSAITDRKNNRIIIRHHF